MDFYVKDRCIYDTVVPEGHMTLRKPELHLKEDREMLKAGILDEKSFYDGYTPYTNPVENIIRDGPTLVKMGYYDKLEEMGFRLGIDNPNDHKYDIVTRDPKWNKAARQILRQHNLRTTAGRDSWQRPLMCGDTSGVSNGSWMFGSTTSATTSTSLTNTGATFPNTGGASGNGLVGHMVHFGGLGVSGVILGVSTDQHTLYVDQWTDVTSGTGAAGSNPGGSAAYVIEPHMAPIRWIGFSTKPGAAYGGTDPVATDALYYSTGLYTDGNGIGGTGTATEVTSVTAPGLQRAFYTPTFGTAGTITVAGTAIYTGSTQVTIYRGLFCNTKAVPNVNTTGPVVGTGTLLVFETNLNAPATFWTNTDNMLTTWSIAL